MNKMMLSIHLQSLEIDRRIQAHEAILDSLVQTIQKKRPVGETKAIPKKKKRTFTDGLLSGGSVGWSKNITSLCQLWKEYEVGFNGNPSISSLNKYQPDWVPPDRLKFHHTRMRVIALINNCARRHHISNKKAAARLERKREELNISVARVGQNPSKFAPYHLELPHATFK